MPMPMPMPIPISIQQYIGKFHHILFQSQYKKISSSTTLRFSRLRFHVCISRLRLYLLLLLLLRLRLLLRLLLRIRFVCP